MKMDRITFSHPILPFYCCNKAHLAFFKLATAYHERSKHLR